MYKKQINISSTILMAPTILFFIMLAWACYAPLGQGVPASGIINVAAKRTPVQAVTGGRISQVNIEEGAHVRKGDVLIKMEASNALASNSIYKQQFFANVAIKARLSAELLSDNNIKSRAIAQIRSLHISYVESEIDEIIASEKIILNKRQEFQKTQMSALDENSAALKIQSKGLQKQLVQKNEQLQLLSEQLANSKALAQEKIITQTRLIEEQRAISELENSIAVLHTEVDRLISNDLNINLEKMKISKSQQQEIASELAKASIEIQNLAEKIAVTENEIQQQILISPIDGIVFNIAYSKIGMVVPSGGKILEIVPDDSPLIVELQVPASSIDQIQVGQIVDLHTSAFHEISNLNIKGIVKLISADRMPDQQPSYVSQQPHYIANIEFIKESLKPLEGKRMIPGMAVDAIIKSKDRTLMDYLVSPLKKRVSTSMQEP